MSIGGLRKVGKTRFPTIRRSTDIMQPESGDVDFSETLKEYDEERSRSITETEDINQKIIKDNEEHEKRRKKGKEKKIENREAEEEVLDNHIEIDDESVHIDIRV